MANLNFTQKQHFEKIFEMESGYLLDFSNSSLQEFMNDFEIDLGSPKYDKYGSSKAKRFRAFWEVESDILVANVLQALLELAISIRKLDSKDIELAKQYISQLQGKSPIPKAVKTELTEDDFLKQEFLKIDISKLGLDSSFEKVIQQRLDEIKKSLQNEASLSVIFLCGSTLEGLLLHLATQNPQKFNSSKSAPKDKYGKVKQLYDWTLDNLINVAHEESFIKLDIKKFAHTLKDFRNYIHPRQQASQNFNPDKHTAEISWKVLQATIANLSGGRE
ncbi:hypothetical protein AAHK07_02610 [Aliarcobacter cryaerophilus]|uniref:hypothetical protein n=1 Tax=Aliarcobacter cryaerophilus TaxID=28198 RepID=UPI0031812498